MELFLNGDKLREMSINAKDFAKNYDWKKISSSFEKLYFA
jgi:hypothetical protein